MNLCFSEAHPRDRLLRTGMERQITEFYTYMANEHLLRMEQAIRTGREWAQGQRQS